MAKRLVRAKTRIRAGRHPLRRSRARPSSPPRLDAVLEAIYAAFAEGWTDAAGTDAARRELTGEAIFLARLVAGLLPDEPEALGLLALMLHAEARRPARRDAAGDYVPLGWQDPALWDAAHDRRGRGAAAPRQPRWARIGRFQLEAALQSAHVHRCRSGEADWPRVVELYDALLALSASPVVAINRALAVARARRRRRRPRRARRGRRRPAARRVPALLGRPRRAPRAGPARSREARHAYALAIGLERDPAVRRFLQHAQAALPGA